MVQTLSSKLHICNGNTGDICDECGAKIGYCEKHNIPFVKSGLPAIGLGISNCPICNRDAREHLLQSDKATWDELGAGFIEIEPY